MNGVVATPGLQDEPLLVMLSAVLDKICDDQHKKNLGVDNEKANLLRLGEEFLRTHPNTTISQFLRWLLDAPTETCGFDVISPRLLESNVLTPTDIKDFLTFVEEGNEPFSSSDEGYKKLIVESDKLMNQEKDEDWLTTENIEDLEWQFENLSAELSHLNLATSRGAHQLGLLSQTEKELSQEVVDMTGHLTRVLEPANAQADRQLYNLKIRMDNIIQNLFELAENERKADADMDFDDAKVALAQGKFKKNLLRALDKSFPVSSHEQDNSWLSDLQELSSIYGWTLKELAKCSTSISLYQNAIEQLSSNLNTQEANPEMLCQERLTEFHNFFDHDVLEYSSHRADEDVVVVGKLLKHFRELSELTVYCNRMEFIKGQVLDETSRKTAITLCCHAYKELRDYLADGIQEYEGYLASIAQQSNQRIAWLHSLRESMAAWPTPIDHQLLMAVEQEESLSVDLDEMTQEKYHQTTLEEVQCRSQQLFKINSALDAIGSFETRLIDSSSKTHSQLVDLIESHSTLAHRHPVVEQSVSDSIEALRKSVSRLRSELVTLSKKFIPES
ncbi:hypothetical protein DSO57_1010059 [Entomophthora muscae]|uniref:Uncharacterized protein n=1 Tax=Entomophthora muscae TaxID=34485 RepID=A0ACC2TU37_9FUNG|nr:hypothetical protein DSO57_1010059 [Entomophthora muscae]